MERFFTGDHPTRNHSEATADLERRGYVERVPDPDDGRVKIIRLTERGREAQAIGVDSSPS